MELILPSSKVFLENANSSERIVINRGGTRSTKTISLMQLMVERSFLYEERDSLITRLEMPSLRLSAMRDFQNVILKGTRLGNRFLEDYFHHVKSSPVHFINKQTGSKIWFVPSKDSQKVHGVKWDDIVIDEAIEQPYEVFRQFLLRTNAQIFLSFNPKDEHTWINTELEKKRKVRQNDVKVIISSYLDNPFLEPQIIKEIEMLREQDPNYWYIYGKGEYGNVPNKVYRNKKKISLKEFEAIPTHNQFYGVDWGDVHPMGCMHYKYYREQVYGNQVYYKKGMQDDLKDLADEIKKTGYRSGDPVYCDTALPSNIRALKKLNLKALNANKNRDDGISFVKTLPVSVTESSVDYWMENDKYQYITDSNGKPTNQVVKFDDDLMDAERYAIYTHLRRHIYRPGIK